MYIVIIMKSSTTLPSFRQNKKIHTHKAIIESAYALFKKKGYQKTTIADIASSADIAPRTFFSYFSSKEDVLFTEISDIYDSLAITLQSREKSATLDILHAWIIAQAQQLTKQNAYIHQLRRTIVASQVSLQAREKFYFSQIEALLDQEIAIDMNIQKNDLTSRIVASAATAALQSVYEYARQNPISRKTASEIITLADQTAHFLRGGIRAISADHSAQIQK
jgi:AcrR family transcriptional regulator